jgi:hypothetical protein
MSAAQLFRIDPAKNMRRFYRLDVQPDLFGGVSLVREWGRIGRASRLRLDPYLPQATPKPPLTITGAPRKGAATCRLSR